LRLNRILIIEMLLLALSSGFQFAQGQTAVSIERATPQHTAIFQADPTVTGKIALESPKLFEMKRGTYQSWSGGYLTPKVPGFLSTGGSGIYFTGGDIFWPNIGVGFSDPLVSNDSIYFSLNIGDAHLFALDRQTGSVKWRSQREQGHYSPPLIVGDTLCIGADSGNFYAIDLKTAKEKWRHFRPDKSAVGHSPTSDGQRVYYVATNGTLYALDAGTGKLTWAIETQDEHVSSLALDGDGHIFFRTGRQLVSLETESGRRAWTVEIKQNIWLPLAVAHGLIYFRTWEGNIRTIDAKTGTLQPKPSNDDAQSGTRLAIDKERIYFVGKSRHRAFAIDASTRKVLWEFETYMDCTAPVVGGETVYIPCYDGRIYALNAATGKLRWRSSAKKPQLSSPTIASDGVYFISDDGRVYAIR